MTRVSEFVLSYIVNAAWQIVVIAIVAALGSRLLRNGPASFRHRLWLGALCTCLIVPLLTATRSVSRDKTVLTYSEKDSRPATARDEDKLVFSIFENESGTATAPPTPEPQKFLSRLVTRRARVVNASSPAISWLLLAYASFSAWRAIRLLRFWLRKERLRRSAIDTNLPPGVAQIAQRCCTSLDVPSVRIARSNTVRVPYTLGARRPLIVLPEAFCSGGEAQLVSVIGHELAHVARRDYLINFVRELVALPISFHPLTFLINRQIDRARELACDELVSQRLLPPKLYARSLVWAADLSSQARSQALLLSMFDSGSLEERIMRLTRNSKTLSRRFARVALSVTLCSLCVATITLSLFSFELRTQARALFSEGAALAYHGRGEIGASNVSGGNSDAGYVLTTANESGTVRTNDVSTASELGTLTTRGVSTASEGSSASGVSVKTSAAFEQLRSETSVNQSGAQQRAEAACEAGRSGDTGKISTLIAMLGDDTPTELIRCWANGRWSPALNSFKHPSPGEQSAIALASMGRVAFLPLTQQLDHGKATVRRNAAWAIGELTNMPPGERDGAVPRLVTLLTDADEWVRMASARALGEVRNRSAVPALIATLSDRDEQVRALAVWALSELKDRRAVVALCSVLLSDARAEVRRGAAEALGEIASAEALPSLKQALNDPAVNAKAQWAISEIEG